MTVIGLTGSFGTGKTFTASIFRSLGAVVLDADRIAHSALKSGTPTYTRIVKLFGKRILKRNLDIDRKRLASIVFQNRHSLDELNSIVHPEVVKYIRQRIMDAGPKDIVVIDAPLLIEANLMNLANRLVVVKASEKVQIARCMKKFGMTKKECLNRIGNQMPLKKKIEVADFVIDNDGTRADTRKQVMEIWRKVWR
jgi:dephospho-CoA kinase